MRSTQDSGPPTLAWSVNPGRAEPPQRPAPPRQTRDQTPRPARGRTGPAPAPPKPPGPPKRPRATGASAASASLSAQGDTAAVGTAAPAIVTSTPPPSPPEELTVVNAGSAAPSTPPAEFTVIDAKPGDVSNLATRFVKFLSQRTSGTAGPHGAGTAGTVTIGRANDNDIVIPDVLASREHATLTLTPLGTEIRDRSINGTFVNGIRVGSAILTEGDVVTIGNVDLVFSNSTLLPARRRKHAPAVSRCTASNTPSTTANNSWTTSR